MTNKVNFSDANIELPDNSQTQLKIINMNYVEAKNHKKELDESQYKLEEITFDIIIVPSNPDDFTKYISD